VLIVAIFVAPRRRSIKAILRAMLWICMSHG
jgi:hypothetical protein